MTGFGSSGSVRFRRALLRGGQPCQRSRKPHNVGEHISGELRINDRIRVPEVRLIGAEGEQVGVVSITEAIQRANDSDLDLVEVAPTARPPVCKIMDYGKFKYENAQKARESRRNQTLTIIKEMKLRPKIDPHDYETKKGHVIRFLKAGDKVKITIMFRGREQSRPELGYRLLQRLAADVNELGVIESDPKQDGRNMVMVIAPHKTPPKTTRVDAPVPAAAPASAPATAEAAPVEAPAAEAAPETAPTPAPEPEVAAAVTAPQPEPEAAPAPKPEATQTPKPTKAPAAKAPAVKAPPAKSPAAKPAAKAPAKKAPTKAAVKAAEAPA